VADGFAGVTTNAGKAKIKGAEFEAVGQLTDAFSANLAIGYVNADYTKWLVGATDPVTGEPTFTDISGQRVFQNTPKWSGFLSLRYEWPLSLFGMSGRLAAIGSAAYKSKTYQFEIPNPLTDQPSYWLYDASLVWTSDNDRYELGLYGRNLADKEYIVASYDFPTVDNSVIGFYGNPRTVTASFTIRY
jgi:iron complex outermembrane receptor protein